ncbi:class I SAM-dependent methyltransferase [Pinirhizobacter soli]|uniref:class I SAM-dependent methyltransferase n=1 Tax=Pinirhizobacter soli TaxID=2786953 RepID=UPI00202A540F|nr:class I SAM-dependent methyltransferase [Pinirhizobacter soli]
MQSNDPHPKRSEFDHYAGQYDDMHVASIAASGEEPAYFSAYKAQYMAAHARAGMPAPVILDFGCGIGNSLPHLHASFPAAVLHGSDPSGESIRMAKARVGDIASVVESPDDALPYADHTFDLALVACVLHHIRPYDRTRWMAELRRVMRPGGQLFIFEHNMLNPLTRKVVRDCPFDEDAVFLPRTELLGLMRDAGFAQVDSQYVVFFPRPLAALRPLEPLLGWLPLGAQYVVQGRA